MRYLNTKQTAEVLGVSKATVNNMCKDGRLRWSNLAEPGSRPRIRVSEDDIKSFMEARASQGAA